MSLSPNTVYEKEHHGELDCRCNLNIDCGKCDLGNHRLMVYVRLFIEILSFGLFVTQAAFGGVYLDSDIYPLGNSTLCNIQPGTYITIDVQKILLVIGIIGALMVVSRVSHFITLQYYSEYKNTVTAFNISYGISYILVVVFTIIQVVFLLKTCRDFDPGFSVFVLSMLYNAAVTFSLLVLKLNEYFIPDLGDLQSLLSVPTSNANNNNN
jgi:uncharacterized membrane protein YidH (DUF202 family)